MVRFKLFYFVVCGLDDMWNTNVMFQQMKRKKRTQRTRMSKEICVDSLMMEMRRRRKGRRKKIVKRVEAEGGVTQRRK